ncbi:MAG: metalloregulator ArsR/SmtB family transcription factor [Gemmataceae bacterium]|nr:metalloregulator ArsR/SmtB family transcription factor [Gemmataceae bacterium]
MAAAKKKPSMSDRHVQALSRKFKLLADVNRLKILIMLAREGETHVSALCEMLGQSQPAVSHHLTLLRTAGLVGFRRDGKFNYYNLDGFDFASDLDDLFGEAGRAGKIDFGEFTLSYNRNGRKK